jgi:hypothetical protein
LSKTARKSLKFEPNLMKSKEKKMGKCRSTPVTSDPWTKTTKNATNSEINFRAIFWAKFWEFFFAKLERFEGQIRGNLCSDTI